MALVVVCGDVFSCSYLCYPYFCSRYGRVSLVYHLVLDGVFTYIFGVCFCSLDYVW